VKSIATVLTSIAAVLFVALVTCSPSFSQSEPDFWQQTNGPFGDTIQALAINSNGDIFAGNYQGGVFRSSDNGDNWTASGLPDQNVYAFAFNSSGDVFAGTNNVVYRSSDNGDNWTQINTGMIFTIVLALAINSSGDIFAGTWAGVFRSSNNGDNWTAINSGLSNTAVPALAINSSGDIYAGTLTSRVFRSVISTVGTATEGESTLPTEFALHQNYPNPFNPSTSILYSLPEAGRVQLTIFDLLGRQVAVLVDRLQAAGDHQITFQAANLSSGIYIYRLEAGRTVRTRKMMLLK